MSRMSGSARSRRNHTLLCLMAVYGIHGVLFHVLSSSPDLVTSIIVEPAYLQNIISKSRTSSDTSFYNQTFTTMNKTKNNDSVHLSVIYRTNIIEKNVEVWLRNKSDSSPSEVPLKENLVLEKSEHSGSSVAMDYLPDSKSSSTTSGTLSVMAFLSSDVKFLKILSPSAWGVFIGCLVFLFTSTDCKRESTAR